MRFCIHSDSRASWYDRHWLNNFTQSDRTLTNRMQLQCLRSCVDLRKPYILFENPQSRGIEWQKRSIRLALERFQFIIIVLNCQQVAMHFHRINIKVIEWLKRNSFIQWCVLSRKSANRNAIKYIEGAVIVGMLIVPTLHTHSLTKSLFHSVLSCDSNHELAGWNFCTNTRVDVYVPFVHSHNISQFNFHPFRVTRFECIEHITAMDANELAQSVILRSFWCHMFGGRCRSSTLVVWGVGARINA